jgi:hypothetical protein
MNPKPDINICLPCAAKYQGDVLMTESERMLTDVSVRREIILRDVSLRFGNGQVFFCPCKMPFGFFIEDGIPDKCPYFLEHFIECESNELS